MLKITTYNTVKAQITHGGAFARILFPSTWFPWQLLQLKMSYNIEILLSSLTKLIPKSLTIQGEFMDFQMLQVILEVQLENWWLQQVFYCHLLLLTAFISKLFRSCSWQKQKIHGCSFKRKIRAIKRKGQRKNNLKEHSLQKSRRCLRKTLLLRLPYVRVQRYSL